MLRRVSACWLFLIERARTMNGQGLTDDWRFTKVYIREAQKWRVVAFQASEAARP